jgi:hypothetical protein
VSVSALGLKVTSRYAAVLDERDTGTADAFEEIFAGSLLVAEFLTRLQTWWSPNDLVGGYRDYDGHALRRTD